MKGKLLVLAGAAVGYVFGTRAGRERYEQIKGSVNRMWHDPRVQEKVGDAEQFLTDTAKTTMPQVQEKLADAARTVADATKSRFSDDEDAAFEPDDALDPGRAYGRDDDSTAEDDLRHRTP